MRVVVGDVLSPAFVNPHVRIQVDRKNHVIREGRNHGFFYAPFYGAAQTAGDRLPASPWAWRGKTAHAAGQGPPQAGGNGGGGIRTHGTLSRTAVFKTASFDHSDTPP